MSVCGIACVVLVLECRSMLLEYTAYMVNFASVLVVFILSPSAPPLRNAVTTSPPPHTPTVAFEFDPPLSPYARVFPIFVVTSAGAVAGFTKGDIRDSMAEKKVSCIPKLIVAQ